VNPARIGAFCEKETRVKALWTSGGASQMNKVIRTLHGEFSEGPIGFQKPKKGGGILTRRRNPNKGIRVKINLEIICAPTK